MYLHNNFIYVGGSFSKVDGIKPYYGKYTLSTIDGNINMDETAFYVGSGRQSNPAYTIEVIKAFDYNGQVLFVGLMPARGMAEALQNFDAKIIFGTRVYSLVMHSSVLYFNA